ncbi:MAG: GrpE protein [Frankiales bacterium]|nr:GrpE protein [Frankiales bacterium]
MSPGHDTERDRDEPPIVITDKRRLDPETGEARPDAVVEAPEPEPVNEHLADLQRITAEYANYRKRVDRDRVAVVEMATAGLLEALLPLLDNIELARQHGDLEGAFKGVGESLEQLAERQGLERYGAKGEDFDPAVHHALVSAPADPEATVTVVAEVLQPGWRLRSGRILRPAGVAVAEPAAEPSGAPATPSETATTAGPAQPVAPEQTPEQTAAPEQTA